MKAINWNRRDCVIQAIKERYIPEPISGCWIWLGIPDKDGYGRFRIRKSQMPAHRVVYEFMKSPIPVGLTLDHKCRNKICVNPNHLEPVTNKINILRGVGAAAINSRKTQCLNKHRLSSDNLVKSYLNKGQRVCAICFKEYCRIWKERNREKSNGYSKKWRINNPQKVKERKLRYEAEHRSLINQYARKWRARQKALSKEMIT